MVSKVLLAAVVVGVLPQEISILLALGLSPVIPESAGATTEQEQIDDANLRNLNITDHGVISFQC